MATPRISVPISPPPSHFARPVSHADVLANLDRELQAALGPQYLVEERVGAGGFAIVFLVRDLSLGRRLAVKVLSPDMALSRSGLERFHREAASIARLSHPNIVPLHFAGQHGDLVYLAMAYIEGESLADRLGREGALPVEEAVRILREVASALDLAHRRGIVHRDVKPANILLERDGGRALVTDFRVARVADEANLTTAGLVVGTPAYFSPEQVGGVTSDARSDLYSLGLVAYEMLAGRLPFGGITTNESLIRRLADKPAPIRKARAEVPSALEAIVMHCLEPEPTERFQTGGEIVRALDGEVPASTGRRGSILRPSPRHRLGLWAGVGATAAIAAAAGVWALTRPPRLPPGPVTPPGMVVVPAGVYSIGSDDEVNARPAHRVTLPAFAIDSTEVTVRAYRRFVQETNAERPWGAVAPDSMLPVTGVRWSEAAAHCAWRVRGGRLPTEFEWEAAARGLEGRRFPWGDIPDTTRAAVAADTTRAAITRLTARGPAAVASHVRGNTPLGVSDMVGNVWEWTASRYLPYPGGSEPSGGENLYVIRGGSYTYPIRYTTTYVRSGVEGSPADRAGIAQTGFRCAAPLPEPPRGR